MRGVYFGDYHTVNDWGLILTAKSIDPPTPKIVTVNVDGRDGSLDLSRALTDDIKFDDREASFTFIITEGTQSDRAYMLQSIINAIHGQRLKIIDPDFPELYLIGECKVSNVVNDKAYGSFTISATCEPYRYYIDEINRLITLSSTATTVYITNTGRKILIPTVTVNGSAKIVIGSTSIALESGTYKLTSLKLPNGSTPIIVSGSGTLTITYREAVL